MLHRLRTSRLTCSAQASAEHFQQCAEFLLLRDCGWSVRRGGTAHFACQVGLRRRAIGSGPFSSPCREQNAILTTVAQCGHGASVCPSERPGATRSRMSCLISLSSGKRPCSFRDQMTSLLTRTSKTPPVPSGVSVNPHSPDDALILVTGAAIQI